MDVFNAIGEGKLGSNDVLIKTVDMHTSGEATRIVLPITDERGQFIFQGRTLLEKRAYAKEHADWLRQRIMREPRGHSEMYGAILIPETELTAAGEADIGVLFCHNEGYSTMCGHASIALGRFLVDTTDLDIFPRRHTLPYDAQTRETLVRLHAPCGVVEISVPTVATTTTTTTTTKSDPTRRVSFKSVPSFTTSLALTVSIPPHLQWPALRSSGQHAVTLDVAYGGAFYAIVDARALGFPESEELESEVNALREASRVVKETLLDRKELYVHMHPDSDSDAEVGDLEYLYGVIVRVRVTEQVSEKHELGVCFFADQQLDRSPTGSGVCARIALGMAKGELQDGEEVLFDSLVSRGRGLGFTGRAVERVSLRGREGRVVEAVRVVVSGQAYYTGAHAFVVESGDGLGNGFLISS